ncbi:MAG: dephospho-CoA kinase [Candidatus Midichloria sp.]|uniref:Dephospho-CoA kinase n=1 Tax=Hyalomma marginatum TaxID=34627 RepID=A0A8S4BYF4_9ACAR|nr:dephospho-CoA kinase [Hyalomma marginatum]CAG7600893.1 dephospho-CoA kinase [Hyalomma marginatum]
MSRHRKKKLSRAGLVIIITGGIASGKSLVLQHFANLGFETSSLDEIANTFLAKNSPVYIKITQAFPECVSQVNGDLDKRLLSALVFSAPEKLKLLNSLMHPLIRARYQNIIKDRRRSIIIEIPLMVEAIVRDNYEYENDAIILVKSSYETRLKRIMQRKNMTKERFDAIVALQLSEVVKEEYSDFIIENENPLAVFNQVEKFLHGRFKRNSFRY